jgi:hypothetical protein
MWSEGSLLAYSNLPLDPNLSWINLVQILSAYSSKINFNIILLSVPSSTKKFRPFSFYNQNFVHISHLPHNDKNYIKEKEALPLMEKTE